METAISSPVVLLLLQNGGQGTGLAIVGGPSDLWYILWICHLLGCASISYVVERKEMRQDRQWHGKRVTNQSRWLTLKAKIWIRTPTCWEKKEGTDSEIREMWETANEKEQTQKLVKWQCVCEMGRGDRGRKPGKLMFNLRKVCEKIELQYSDTL